MTVANVVKVDSAIPVSVVNSLTSIVTSAFALNVGVKPLTLSRLKP